jgi:hypothetical protein
MLPNFSSDHIGHLDNLPMLAVVGTRLDVVERSSLDASECLTDGRPEVANLLEVSALKVDIQLLPGDKSVGTPDHQVNHPITDSIGATRLLQVLLRP